MKIIVTGAAGFIGSNLVRELSSAGHRVFSVDNLHTGTEKNIAGLENVRFFSIESGSLDTLTLPFIDVIMHLGMPSSAPMYVKEPELEQKTVNEFRALLEFAKTSDSKVVFASTSSLYGCLPVPQSETMKVRPFDGYTRARFEIERLAREHSKNTGLSSVGLRLFSVYGPGEEHKGIYANIISQFLWKMQKGGRPQIYGDGRQTRDFIFVDDVVTAFMNAMEHDGSGIFNIGTGVRTSFNQVVDMLNEAIGKDIKPIYAPNPIKDYVRHTQADCTIAREEIGFYSSCNLENGIKKMLSVS